VARCLRSLAELKLYMKEDYYEAKKLIEDALIIVKKNED
jgi:hypothetical protein